LRLMLTGGLRLNKQNKHLQGFSQSSASCGGLRLNENQAQNGT
jgi:hypothetical protein